MPKHADLLGSELHPTKLSIEAPTRAPRFIGETIFDATETAIWVAAGTTIDSWQQVSGGASGGGEGVVPVVYSWTIDGVNLDSNYQSLQLFYAPSTDAFATQEWELLRQWGLGEGLAFGSAASITTWIEYRGVGYYVPCVTGRDANSNTIAYPLPLTVTYCNISINTQAEIIQIFNLDVFDPFGVPPTANVKGFQVLTPLAHVHLRVG